MMEKIILKTPGEKMAFLATVCLILLYIIFFCLFWFGFFVENTLECFGFFYLISLRLESGLSSSHLYVPFIIVQQM